MRRDDYILALTTGFLTVEEDRLNEVIDEFQDQLELKKLGKPGNISAGGRDPFNNEVSLYQWVKSYREQKIKKISCILKATDLNGSIASHQAAAFSGSQQFVLHVVSEKSTKTFHQKTIHSNRYEILPEHFSKLVNAQHNPQHLWDRIEEILTQFNTHNKLQTIQAKSIQKYFLTSEATNTFKTLSQQLFQEIQIECKISGAPFTIPNEQKDLFCQSNSVASSPITHIAFLYPVKDVMPDELLMLMRAQSFHDQIWVNCVSDATNYPNPILPKLEASWEANSFVQLNKDARNVLTQIVCRVICRLCEVKKLKPIIPATLKDRFGPDELEEKRAQLRSGMGDDQWFLQRTKKPWELYFLEEMSMVFPKGFSYDLNETKNKFKRSLKDIAEFSTSHNSPFSETFVLAQYLLSEDTPGGNFDLPHRNRIKTELIKRRFSLNTLKNFEQSFFLARDFKRFGWCDSKILGLLAVSNADSFGGMGSWNDISVGEKELYQTISKETFCSMRNYLAALLSTFS